MIKGDHLRDRILNKTVLAVVLISFIMTAFSPAALSRKQDDTPGSILASKTLTRVEPVVILGSQVPGFAGYDVNNLFVWSWINGWHQVVFQIDEANGTFMRKDVPTSSAGPQKQFYIPDDGVLDNDDEIVFLANETGDRINAGWWPPGADTGTDRYEITISDPLTGFTGWAYIYYHPTPPAWTTVDYVNWNEASNRVDAYGYTLDYNDNEDRMLYFTEMSIDPNIGGDGVDLVDRNKRAVGIDVSIVPERSEGGNSNRGLETYNPGLDDDPTYNHDYAVKDGPVRVLKHIRWGFGSANLFDLSDKMGFRSGDEFKYYPTMYKEYQDMSSQSTVNIEYYYRAIDHDSNAGPMTYFNSESGTGTVNGNAGDDSVPTTLMSWDQVSSPHGSYVTTYDIGTWSKEGSCPCIKTTRWLDDTADPDTDSDRAGAQAGRYGEHGIYMERGTPSTDTRWGNSEHFFNFYFMGGNKPNVGQQYSDYYNNPLETDNPAPQQQSFKDDVQPPATIGGSVLVEGLTSYATTVSTAGVVQLTGTVDETGQGDANISAAEWTNGFANFPGTAMAASDGGFGGEISEDVEANINLAGWSAGSYDIYIYGTDDEGNKNTTATEHATITITDDLPPITQGATVQIDGGASYFTPFSTASPVTLTATVDDTGRGDSNIASAVWTDGFANFPGTAMSAADGGFDSPTEDVTQTLALDTWDAGVYDIHVYGMDTTPLQDTTSTEHATVTIVDDVEPVIASVLVEGAPIYTTGYSENNFVELTATVDDSASGGTVIAGANFTVGADNWPGQVMTPLTALDSAVETFNFTVNVSGWAPGTYLFYAYGWDSAFNYIGTPGLFATLVINNDWAPEVHNVLVDGNPTVLVPYSARSTVTLTATIDDTDHGNDTIAGANYTIGISNWPSSVDMVADDALDFRIENFSALVDVSGWEVGTYDLYVYGWDIQNDANLTSLEFGRIIIYDDIPPVTDYVKINGLATYETDSVSASTITLTSRINDAGHGESNIGGANYTVGERNWPTAAAMTPDTALDSVDETFTETVDISSWPAGIYDLYVYGWDDVPNYNAVSSPYARLIIHDVLAPLVQNVRVNGSFSYVVPYAAATNVRLTATLNDTGRGDSEIGGANFTDGFANWSTSTPMFTYNDEALADIPVEGVVSSDDYSAPNDYLNTGQYPNDGRYEHITEASGGLTVTEYTYNGVTSPSATHVARRLEVDAMPPTGGNINGNAEATTAQYGEVTGSDDSRWITADPGWGDENFMWSEFQISENPAYIAEIVLSFEGQGNAATNFNLWVMDSGTWTDTGATVACAADTDGTVIYPITSNFANYIIGGTLTWGAYQTDSSDLIRVDKMNVTVKWMMPAEHRWQFDMGSNPTFYIDASNPAGSDSDFTMEWSDDNGGSWNPFPTPIVFTPGEVDVLKSSAIPLAAYNSNFLVRVIATNQVGSNLDTFSVDRMWAEGQFNNNPENVYADIDISGWQPGIYELYVYGWDKTPQYNITSMAYATLTILDDLPPEIYNFLAEGQKFLDWNISAGPLTLTGLVDDTNTGNSWIAAAAYSIGLAGEEGDLMVNDTALDSAVETFTQFLDPWNWTYGPHQLYMTGKDAVGLVNESSTENVTINLIDDVAPATVDWSATVNGAFQIWVNPALTSQVFLNVTISDVDRGYSVVEDANWTVGPQNWTDSWMEPLDGAADNYTEDFTDVINITGWPTGSYYIYVYGIDDFYNGQTATSTYAIIHVDADGPAITGPWADGVRPILYKDGGTFQLTAYGDERGTGGSIITGAEYFVDWTGTNGTGVPMSPTGFRFDSVYEGAKANVDFSGWTLGEYHVYYVHFVDSLGHWGPFDEVTVMRRTDFAIPVHLGWNLISLPLIQGDCGILQALDDDGGATDWDVAMYYDNTAPPSNSWKSFNKGTPLAVNQLTQVDHTIALWINITDVGDDFLNIVGAKPGPVSITLEAGWNFVGYPTLNNTVTVDEALSGTGYTDIVGYDGGSPYLQSSLPGTYVMQPGEGYWIKVPATVAWLVDW